MSVVSKKSNFYNKIIALILIVLSVICILPFVHVISVSLSNSLDVMEGNVLFWPKNLTFSSYIYILKGSVFWQTFGVSVKRTVLGVSLNFVIAVLAAFPLSRTDSQFKYRTFFSWYFFATMIFNGGLIPTYMVVRETNLLDTIWALVLPTGVRVFGITVLLNFFRNVPKEIDEAAEMDGASPWVLLFKIYLPISLASIATIILFFTVFHWNSWFDGLLYMGRTERMPVQSYLQTLLIGEDTTSLENVTDYKLIMETNNSTLKNAQIIVACLPILIVYPFLQKYFVKGIMVGGVKG